MESTISTTSGLPQEIIDNIIDCSALPRDLKVLKNYALVCRAFLPRAQRHIFVGVRIFCAIQHGKIRTGGRRLDELYDILHHSPHIAGYVREIRLVVKDNGSWVVGNPKFEWIVDKLTRNTVFNRFHFDGHLSNDKSLVPSHFQSFENSFSQPYIVPFITSLKLYRIKNIPISLLVNSLRLKKLTLVRATLGDIETRGASFTNLPQLQELYFHRCTEMITTLLGNPQNGSPPLIDLTHLHTLSVNQDSLEDVQCAMRIIEATAGSLKQLNFIHRNSNVYVPFTGPLNLTTIPNLRGLRLDTVCGDKDALADLDSIFSTIQPTHRITKMRITVHMSDRTGLSPGKALDVWCTKLDTAITKLYQGKTISLHLQLFFPRRPSRIIVSKRKQALREFRDMSQSEISQTVLAKFPLVAMHPGVAVAVSRQTDQKQKGTLRGIKGFLHRIRDLVRGR